MYLCLHAWDTRSTFEFQQRSYVGISSHPLLGIHCLYLNGTESGFEVFYCDITCGVWGMDMFLFLLLVSGYFG